MWVGVLVEGVGGGGLVRAALGIYQIPLAIQQSCET